MKRIILSMLLILAACGEKPITAGTNVVYQTVYKEVQRPCPVTVPALPAPLAKPLPTDAGALVSLLTAKLKEWAGPGAYGQKADSALKQCTKP